MFLVDIILLLFLGTIGYILFYMLGFPTPALLGAYTVIAAIRIAGFTIPEPHPDFILAVQILLGMYVGIRLNREACKQLHLLLRPVILISLWSIGITLGVGYLLFAFVNLDMQTAILGASPSGVDMMCVVACSIGADTAVVGILQIFRLTLTLVIFPLLLKHNKPKQDLLINISERTQGLIMRNITRKGINKFCKDFLTLCSPSVIKATGGYLGTIFKLPAGGMLGALFCTAGAVISGTEMKPPFASLRILMEIGIGIMVGFNMSREVLYSFHKLLIPVIMSSVLVVMSSLLLGIGVHRITGWEKGECYLAVAPGGFAPMVLLADELGYRPFIVSMLQMTRVLTIGCIVPVLVLLF